MYCGGGEIRASRAGKEVRSDTKRKKDSRGMTLIELIVTFAVAAIFMAAAALLVVPATRMTMHIKGINRVHDDAAIIMETIRNELSYADALTENTDSEGSSIPAITLKGAYPAAAGDVGYDAEYSGCYKAAVYSDKGGNPAEISVGDGTDSDAEGRLQIVYTEISDHPDGEEENKEVIREEITWWYGKGLYQNNRIRLGFRKKPDKNIITVKLTVTDTLSGYSYTEEADIRCMNVSAYRIEENSAP